MSADKLWFMGAVACILYGGLSMKYGLKHWPDRLLWALFGFVVMCVGTVSLVIALVLYFYGCV